MIVLDTKIYCNDCPDFEADVKKPEKIGDGFDVQNQVWCWHWSDTIVRCKNANRCEAVKRYLERKIIRSDGE